MKGQAGCQYQSLTDYNRKLARLSSYNFSRGQQTRRSQNGARHGAKKAPDRMPKGHKVKCKEGTIKRPKRH
jgi:hypothetical protein